MTTRRAGSRDAPYAGTVVTPSRGRRQCARTIKQIGAQSGQGELLGFAVADGAGKGIPKEFRQAVAAGCQAATG